MMLTLAILENYRSYGFGKVLMNSVHDWARSQLKAEDDEFRIALHFTGTSCLTCLPF